MKLLGRDGRDETELDIRFYSQTKGSVQLGMCPTSWAPPSSPHSTGKTLSCLLPQSKVWWIFWVPANLQHC